MAMPRSPALTLAALQTWLCNLYPFLETEDGSLWSYKSKSLALFLFFPQGPT